MKTIKLLMAGTILLAFLMTGCGIDDPSQPQLTIEQPEGVKALTTYVAIGNSLTAGYMDSGLIMNGQTSSYPFMIAMQLGYSPVPGADNWFAMPLVSWPGIGTTSLPIDDHVAGVLHWDTDEETITPVSITPQTEVPGLLLASSWPTSYNDLGVPGATLLDATQAVDSSTSQSPGNSFFDFILRNPTFGNVNMLDQAISKGPTLASIWLGNNDVLGGATGGNPVVGENVTPPANFEAMLEGVVAGMIDGVQNRFGYDPHLVVGNIPSITAIPYFVPKALFDQVVGVELPTEETDVVYMTFTALSAVNADGFTPPLASNYTLTGAEVTAVGDAVDAYNDIIDDLATTYDFTVADLNGALADLDPTQGTHFLFLVGNGMSWEDAASTTYFSLDGVHPNNMGYSVVTNTFVDAINTQLGLEGEDMLSHIPAVPGSWNPTYPAVAPGTLVSN